jgi:hypothetical protein
MHDIAVFVSTDVLAFGIYWERDYSSSDNIIPGIYLLGGLRDYFRTIGVGNVFCIWRRNGMHHRDESVKIGDVARMRGDRQHKFEFFEKELVE